MGAASTASEARKLLAQALQLALRSVALADKRGHLGAVGVDVADETGLTPLMAAAQSGHVDAVVQLLAAAANVFARDALPCVLMTSRLSVELTKLAARDSWVPFFPRWLERQLWRGAVNEALAEMQERVASALVGEYEDWSKRPAVTPASE